MNQSETGVPAMSVNDYEPTPDARTEEERAVRQTDAFGVSDVVAGYERHGAGLVDAYERLSFEDVHAKVLDLLPEAAGRVLDVGAGSGREAAWFAARGHEVVAVEPSAVMRDAARARHASPRIRWVDDRLPALDKVRWAKQAFDLVWVSAVWMHVPRSERFRCFGRLASVVRPGGGMMVSLRHGPPPPGRPMEPATAAEIETLARRHGLRTVRVGRYADAAGRPGVSWEVVWLGFPSEARSVSRVPAATRYRRSRRPG